MQVKYIVKSSLTGKSFEQSVEIDDEELSECENLESKKRYIGYVVEEDYKNTIAFTIEYPENLCS